MSQKLIDWIEEEKDKRGWTYRQIAKFAGDVTHVQIVNVVNEKRAVTFNFCKSMSKAFDVSLRDLLRLTDIAEGTDLIECEEAPELEPAL